ncbi:uncharacterized protein VDAG_09122 [Verticillium dahliae VdLs.17]|uniref:PA14 domain-containing protein n=2 Tax=Verticillium dahliae TaxID=27337 RepID=G2XFJ8_VERDV|nr:uncharacterized protein VDAG_09122 [Verticillium dahliae VdLs.17]EGY18596.1 hypothetical protein VDAG_09122 [Verticillium dahliae VdLs.17]KAH6669080.1 GLEYA domain-containing protein [Verticillium dahliae]KAH6691991.1 GLEYA domain-containing protein [Verticillium dahliae]
MKLFSPAVVGSLAAWPVLTQNVEIISCTDDATFTHTTSVVRTLVFHARPPYVLVHEGYEGPVPTTVTFAPTGTDPGTIVVYTPTDAPEDEQNKKDGSQSVRTTSRHPEGGWPTNWPYPPPWVPGHSDSHDKFVPYPTNTGQFTTLKSEASPGTSTRAAFDSPASGSEAPSDSWLPIESIISNSQNAMESKSAGSSSEPLSSSGFPFPSSLLPQSNFILPNSNSAEPSSATPSGNSFPPFFSFDAPVPSSLSPQPSSLLPNSASAGPSSLIPLPSSFASLPSSIIPSSIIPSSVIPSSIEPSSLEPVPGSIGPSSISPPPISLEPIPSSVGPSSISPLPSSLEPIPSSVGPSSSQPSSLEPSSILQSSAQPSSFEPQPSSLGPSSIEPSSIIPSPSSFEPIPSSLRPSSIEPVSSIPSASSFEPLPSSALPSSAQPSSAQPSSVQPSSAQPSSAAPSSVAPSSAQPSSAAPSSVQPSSAAPSSAVPSSMHPSSVQSSASPSSSAPAPTPDVSCNNRGLEYAIYDHSFFNSDFPAFSSLDVNYFHVTQPAFTGTTERIGIPPGTNPYFPPFSIYDDTPARLYMFTAVNHRAFLYAPVTGTYTITVPDSDEITLVWLGDKAISTWTRANADLEQDYNTVDGPEETTVFRIQLQAGTYTPFRLLWANAQGELSFIARVQAPDGRIIEDGDGSDSDYFVRFACDMSTPEYPPFGQNG